MARSRGVRRNVNRSNFRVRATKNHLRELSQPEDSTGCQQTTEPIASAQRDGTERLLHRWHVYHHHLQCERETDRRPHPVIREKARKRAPLVRTGVEDVEELRQRE